jgi:PAS domain S-box-containing protein
MDADKLFSRYQELQQYVGWTADDARRAQSVAGLLQPFLPALVDDFYAEIERHPGAMKVITGGQQQIQRLKRTLVKWLEELLTGPYESDYVARRWKAGWRHVEIGLDQVYTNVALSRLRKGLLTALDENLAGGVPELRAIRRSLNMLMDLDLAIIEDAYQAEYLVRQQQSERQAAMGQVARAKERSEAAFRSLVEAAPCMIVILNRDYTVLYFSPFAEELTGYAAAEVLGKEFYSIFIPDAGLREAISQRKKDTLAGTSTRGFECFISCKDGSQRWMVWNAELLTNYEEESAILTVGQDITSLKQAQEQALQSERLAAIGQMMAGLAHESGNALARSQACLEMLTFAVENQPKALNLISRIQLAQDHLKQLYDEVRNYSAPLKLDLEECSIPTIWRQAWDNLALVRKGKSATLTEDLGGLDLRLCVDPFRLGQVFRNILDNALAACSEPIEIKVVCAAAGIDGRPAVRIAFRDNGPGLSAEQQQRIFEPFFTTKTKGTGLGMAIAKRIIEAHAGWIRIGTVDHGAEIIVTLPRNRS